MSTATEVVPRTAPCSSVSASIERENERFRPNSSKFVSNSCASPVSRALPWAAQRNFHARLGLCEFLGGRVGPLLELIPGRFQFVEGAHMRGDLGLQPVA